MLSLQQQQVLYLSLSLLYREDQRRLRGELQLDLVVIRYLANKRKRNREKEQMMIVMMMIVMMMIIIN